MFNLKMFKIMLISFILTIPVNAAATKNTSQVINIPYATWLWHTEQIVQNPDQMIDFLVENNVKHLYLQIDYTLNLNTYKSFIKKAFENGIEVHALEGSAKWVSDDGADRQILFFKWLAEYQKAALDSEKFRGIHLDVEPYLNEQYDSMRNSVLQNYQDLLMHALNMSKEMKVPLAVDIPFWFDEVTYHTKYGKGMLDEWIISHVKDVTIMAYRNSALGDNGIVRLISREMKLAQSYEATIRIAVETQQSEEGNAVSFYEEGQAYMNNELKIVYDKYKKSKGFGGFAMHHIISWMDLRK
ncbi:MAG: hypothetical protein K0S71_166 [Clostridia bacterium]|jgi:hypothetical protein|nr:hypothetical protein [Clostridia bacterium]